MITVKLKNYDKRIKRTEEEGLHTASLLFAPICSSCEKTRQMTILSKVCSASILCVRAAV